MSTALVPVESQPAFTTRQIDLIKRQIAPGIDDGNLALFGMVCRRTGLDPFMRQIYTIQRGGKWTIQTGIDGYRLLAARTGQLAGIDDAEYDTEEADYPAWARVTVWRLVGGQRVPFSAKARWSEYKPAQGGMWDRMPYLMLGKCAEALALRKAFPAELSGVYTSEEMAQADAVDVTPIAPTPAATEEAPARKSAADNDVIWGEIARVADELGLTKEQRATLTRVHKRNALAIYKALTKMAEKARAQRPAAAPQDDEGVTFEEDTTEPEHSLQGLPIHGA